MSTNVRIKRKKYWKPFKIYVSKTWLMWLTNSNLHWKYVCTSTKKAAGRLRCPRWVANDHGTNAPVSSSTTTTTSIDQTNIKITKPVRVRKSQGTSFILGILILLSVIVLFMMTESNSFNQIDKKIDWVTIMSVVAFVLLVIASVISSIIYKNFKKAGAIAGITNQSTPSTHKTNWFPLSKSFTLKLFGLILLTSIIALWANSIGMSFSTNSDRNVGYVTPNYHKNQIVPAYIEVDALPGVWSEPIVVPSDWNIASTATGHIKVRVTYTDGTYEIFDDYPGVPNNIKKYVWRFEYMSATDKKETVRISRWKKT